MKSSVKEAGSSAKKPSKKKSLKRRKTQPSVEKSQKRKVRLNSQRIEIHPAAEMLPELSEDEFELLRSNIIRDDGSVNLTTKIVVDGDGKVVDGRHRVRILREAGYEAELANQIAARGGKWVEVLPPDTPVIGCVYRLQAGRRNTNLGRLQLRLLDEHDEAKRLDSEAKKAKTPNGGRESGGHLKRFYDKYRLRKERISELKLVREFATREELEDTDLAFSCLIRRCTQRRRSEQKLGNNHEVIGEEAQQPTGVRNPNRKANREKGLKSAATRILKLWSECEGNERIDFVRRFVDLIDDPEFKSVLLDHQEKTHCPK